MIIIVYYIWYTTEYIYSSIRYLLYISGVHNYIHSPQDPEERISGTKAGPAKCSSCGQPVGSILFVCLWAQWNPPFVGQDWLEKRMHISGKFWSSRFGRIFVDWVSFTFFFWNHHQLEAMVWDQQTDNIFFWGHQGTTPSDSIHRGELISWEWDMSILASFFFSAENLAIWIARFS